MSWFGRLSWGRSKWYFPKNFLAREQAQLRRALVAYHQWRGQEAVVLEKPPSLGLKQQAGQLLPVPPPWQVLLERLWLPLQYHHCRLQSLQIRNPNSASRPRLRFPSVPY